MKGDGELSCVRRLLVLTICNPSKWSWSTATFQSNQDHLHIPTNLKSDPLQFNYRHCTQAKKTSTQSQFLAKYRLTRTTCNGKKESRILRTVVKHTVNTRLCISPVQMKDLLDAEMHFPEAEPVCSGNLKVFPSSCLFSGHFPLLSSPFSPLIGNRHGISPDFYEFSFRQPWKCKAFRWMIPEGQKNYFSQF